VPSSRAPLQRYIGGGGEQQVLKVGAAIVDDLVGEKVHDGLGVRELHGGIGLVTEHHDIDLAAGAERGQQALDQLQFASLVDL
jgi:hypothetical protein